MKTLNRDDILSADDLRTESVAVPEWGGQVIVRELTGTERDAYESSVVKTDGKKVSVDSTNLRAKLASLSMVGDDGKRLFSEKDVTALGKKSAAALDRVVEVANRLSAIGDAGLEELGKGLKETA